MTKMIVVLILSAVTFSLVLGQLHFMDWKTPEMRKKAAVAAAVIVAVVLGVVLGVFKGPGGFLR